VSRAVILQTVLVAASTELAQTDLTEISSVLIQHEQTVLVLYEHETGYTTLATWLKNRTQVFLLTNGIVALMDYEVFDQFVATFNITDNKGKGIFPSIKPDRSLLRSVHSRSYE